jgi:hypothetical protein
MKAVSHGGVEQVFRPAVKLDKPSRLQPLRYIAHGVEVSTAYFLKLVIPTSVQRARAFTSARVGRRDLVLAF